MLKAFQTTIELEKKKKKKKPPEVINFELQTHNINMKTVTVNFDLPANANK